MICHPGQGILGKLPFKDGTTGKYGRPFLVVDTTSEGVYIVNVSSTEGKEHKLLYSSNIPLDEYEPPFKKPTFVKLDSKCYFKYDELTSCHILNNGRILNQNDLSVIQNELSKN